MWEARRVLRPERASVAEEKRLVRRAAVDVVEPRQVAHEGAVDPRERALSRLDALVGST